MNIKDVVSKVKNVIFDMRPEQKMKLGASCLLFFGATALALAAANDEVIDISEAAEIIDNDRLIDTKETESDVSELDK